MNEFQAAILIAQQERLADMNMKRHNNALLLNQYLEEVEGIEPQGFRDYADGITHYMYMFYYDENKFNGLSRRDFVDRLIEEGIPAFICFPVLSNTTFFKKNDFAHRIDKYDKENEADLSNANRIADEVVWLPHYTLLGDEQDIKEIAEAIVKIQNEKI
jgi:dTDP-4-amino-4,6-dideoxygalactose transaminase